MIELYNPVYDPEANTLKYDITADNATATTTSSIGLPSEFGQSTLVIDDDVNLSFDSTNSPLNLPDASGN